VTRLRPKIACNYAPFALEEPEQTNSAMGLMRKGRITFRVGQPRG
jgi:hypothetical protein